MADALPPDIPILSAPPALQAALIGPCAAAYNVQFFLFGIFVQQVLSYGDFSSHSRLSRWAIGIVLALNVVFTALVFEDSYEQSASADRTVLSLFNGSTVWQFLPFLNGLIAAVAEGFLTIRAGAFFTNRHAKAAFYVWQGGLIILVLFGSAASLAEGLVAIYDPEANETIPYNTAVSLWLWACAAADVSISVALAWNLHQRIAHFNASTDSTIRRLIVIGLRTAAYTAILSVAGALMSSIYSGSDPSRVGIPAAFWVPTSALYGISLFTTLSSSRQVVQQRLGGSSSGTKPPQIKVHHHSRPFSTGGGGGGGGVRHGTGHTGSRASNVIPLAINVHREVVRDVDSEKDDEYDPTLSRSPRPPTAEDYDPTVSRSPKPVRGLALV
ncbi:hypothetical protein JCM10212_004257 [Sporobolomyces blumeae]